MKSPTSRDTLAAMTYEQLRELKDDLEEQRDIMQANADELDRDVMCVECELERREYASTLF